MFHIAHCRWKSNYILSGVFWVTLNLCPVVLMSYDLYPDLMNSCHSGRIFKYSKNWCFRLITPNFLMWVKLALSPPSPVCCSYERNTKNFFFSNQLQNVGTSGSCLLMNLQVGDHMREMPSVFYTMSISNCGLWLDKVLHNTFAF